MANRADDLIDRGRLRRKLTFWRVLAIGLVAVAIIAGSIWAMRDRAPGLGADHIAEFRIEGTITDDRELLERIGRAASSERVKGVIVTISSPGGTTVGGESIYEALREMAQEKPVVAQIGTLAASAGYMVASAADHIVARQSSIVGSIGVLVQFPNLTELLDNIGVSVDGVKSTPLKAEPSPFTPTTEDEREMLRALVMDSYDWFVGLVEERRAISGAALDRVADGSIFTGRQALELELVDALGGRDQALEWLGTREVDAELPVVEWKAAERGGLWRAPLTGEWLGGLLGLDRLGEDLMRRLGADRIFLDGLLSVWQPAGNMQRD